MSDSEKRSHGLLFIPIIALTVFWAPSMAFSDSFLMLHTDRSLPPAHDTGKQISTRPVTVGLNENGDLTIRHRDVSLIVAYSPPNDIIDHQEQLRIAQKLECPPISGISLKVSFLF